MVIHYNVVIYFTHPQLAKKVTLMNNIIACMNVMCVMRVSIIYVIKYFINEAVVYNHHVYLP